MAVILEAYLLGCGQAMLRSFIQQVQAVEALQDVAVTIKSIYPDKTDLPATGGTFWITAGNNLLQGRVRDSYQFC